MLGHLRATAGRSPSAAFLVSGNVAAIVAASGIAYYVASLIGLQLRMPPAVSSVLWPPNAILTTLLLFVPVNRWWAVLAGAAVAHFTVQLPVWPLALVTGLFLTNCSEALIAAILVRAFSDDPTRFNTLRRVTVFVIGGGLLAPFLSSFLDAAVVSAFNTEDYWDVWKKRFLSNVLAQLAVVPAMSSILNRSLKSVDPPGARAIERASISIGLLLVGLAVAFDVGHVGLSNSPLAPFLPLMLWAAVRFGSAGVALTVLGTVLFAVAGALTSDIVLPAVPAQERIPIVQVFLISATIPLMCVGALVEERRRAVHALRSSDLFKSSILTSIPSMVVVLDRQGRVLTANEAWRAAGDRGLGGEPCGESERTYLEDWAGAAQRGHSHARAGHDGIVRVLEGTATSFALEYCVDPQRQTSWWLMSVVPLQSEDGGAVDTHTDISARKRAELDAERSRDELAHASRVWVMGALTAALSHQLKQPLTGIIGNALAGERMLAQTPADTGEVRLILGDIIADAQRASEVTTSIRNMLRKDNSEEEIVNLNEIVRDTTKLATRQAAAHGVVMQLQLSAAAPLVVGKRVQLSQVILNLTMNAIEASIDVVDGRPRVVSIETRLNGGSDVQVSVGDSGCGIRPGSETEIFAPLFTTKASGMGMGLPIARSVVEAHGGKMWLGNAEAGRTVFHFRLPLAQQDSLPLASRV